MRLISMFAAITALLVLCTLVGCSPNGYVIEGEPRIQIGSVPEYGQSGSASGSVGGVDPRQHMVAVYIKVGQQWWTKPYHDTPLTSINRNGQWSCDITTGGEDVNAVEIRAYLVRAGYTPPSAPSEGLPPDPPTADVLAMDAVSRTPPGG